MTLIVDLTPEQEARLRAAARTRNLDPETMIQKMVEELLPARTPLTEDSDPTLALFAQWAQEDAQMTPEEIAQENRTWEEFKTNVNAERDRVGARRVF